MVFSGNLFLDGNHHRAKGHDLPAGMESSQGLVATSRKAGEIDGATMGVNLTVAFLVVGELALIVAYLWVATKISKEPKEDPVAKTMHVICHSGGACVDCPLYIRSLTKQPECVYNRYLKEGK